MVPQPMARAVNSAWGQIKAGGHDGQALQRHEAAVKQAVDAVVGKLQAKAAAAAGGTGALFQGP